MSYLSNDTAEERERIVSIIVSLMEDEEFREWHFGSAGDIFFPNYGDILIELIENG
jgi:hypothetical protein